MVGGDLAVCMQVEVGKVGAGMVWYPDWDKERGLRGEV